MNDSETIRKLGELDALSARIREQAAEIEKLQGKAGWHDAVGMQLLEVLRPDCARGVHGGELYVDTAKRIIRERDEARTRLKTARAALREIATAEAEERILGRIGLAPVLKPV